MTLKAIYNSVASQYKTANRFGSISLSHEVAIEQIKETQLSKLKAPKILDLGVGDGAFLQQLKSHLSNANFTGIDISAEMLARAQQILPITTIEASAIDACRLLPHHTQDLVLAHFINAYIPIHQLFSQANLLTKANGYFSLITTTYESFPAAQKQLAQFIAQDSLVSRVVGHYYKAIVRNTTVASGFDELTQAFKAHDFTILSHHRLEIPIILNNVDELAEFGIEGTWFLNSLTIRMLPKNFLIARLKRLFSHIFTFPYHDTHVIDIILAQK